MRDNTTNSRFLIHRAEHGPTTDAVTDGSDSRRLDAKIRDDHSFEHEVDQHRDVGETVLRKLVDRRRRVLRFVMVERGDGVTVAGKMRAKIRRRQPLPASASM